MNKTKRTQLMELYKIKEVSKGVYSEGFFDGVNIVHKYYSTRISDKRLNDLKKEILSLKKQTKILKKTPKVKSEEQKKQRIKGKIKRMNEAIDFWRNKYESLTKTTDSTES